MLTDYVQWARFHLKFHFQGNSINHPSFIEPKVIWITIWDSEVLLHFRMILLQVEKKLFAFNNSVLHLNYTTSLHFISPSVHGRTWILEISQGLQHVRQQHTCQIFMKINWYDVSGVSLCLCSCSQITI